MQLVREIMILIAEDKRKLQEKFKCMYSVAYYRLYIQFRLKLTFD